MLRTPRFSLVQAALIRLFTAAVLIVAALANVPRVIVPDAVNAAEAAPPSVVQPASPILPMVAQSSAPSDTSTATTAAAAPAAAIEPTAAWVKTNREAALWSGWDAQAKQFSTVAPDMTLQVIEIRGARAYVYFPGDKKGHPAGNVWIDRSALTDLAWPRWVRARQDTALRSDPDVAASSVASLPKGSYVETTGVTKGRWSQAFFLSEASPDAGSVGWIDGVDFGMPRGDQADITTYSLTRAQLASLQPDVWLRVPYRSQLDGSDYADANCGPTTLAMALGSFGVKASVAELRAATMHQQDTDDCDECGSFIQSLASVVEARGLRTFGLHDDPDTLHRWTIDEVRKQLQDGHVVIPQVMFRQLPGRATSPYYGDHFIVITGVAGSNFIYNDPIDTDGRGYGRVISADTLAKAMAAAHDEFAWSAFAVGT